MFAMIADEETRKRLVHPRPIQRFIVQHRAPPRAATATGGMFFSIGRSLHFESTRMTRRDISLVMLGVEHYRGRPVRVITPP